MGLTIVVGGQAGSEGKGAVCGRLHREKKFGIAVRVGGPNAGHTVIDDNGVKFAFRQLPVAAVVDPDCILVIAGGSEVDLPILRSEIEAAEEAGHDIRERLVLDDQATVIDQRHKDLEVGILTGTTGKGIGGVRSERALREAQLVRDVRDDVPEGIHVQETASRLRANLHADAEVLLEGTQGFQLGSHAGSYPYCTSGDCRASDFLAACGIPPMQADIWVVLRSFPIRIAGDSGPLERETTWEEIGVEPEFTTVTKKMRRVGWWNQDWAVAAIEAHRAPGASSPPKIALTFADYWFPDCAGLDGRTHVIDLPPELREKAEDIALSLGAPVAMIGTGPDTQIVMEGWDR